VFLAPNWKDLLAVAGCSRSSRDAICCYAKLNGKRSFSTFRQFDNSSLRVTAQRGDQAEYLCNFSEASTLGQKTRSVRSFGKVMQEMSSFFKKVQAKACDSGEEFDSIRFEIILWALQNNFSVACSMPEDRGVNTCKNFNLRLFGGLDREDCIFLSCLEVPSAPKIDIDKLEKYQREDFFQVPLPTADWPPVPTIASPDSSSVRVSWGFF